MKKTISISLLCSVLLAGGCGAGDKTQNISVLQDDWQTIKEVGGREIIAELKQTGKESPARDQAAQEQFESPDYIGGFFGEPSTELEEDMAVQAIEGPVAIEAVEEVYGGSEGFKKEGILFLENQIYNSADAAQSGVWIGVKNPDARVQKLIDLLQLRVDAGEILAKPIYIFRSPHTQQELYEIQDKVVEVLQDMELEGNSFSLSVNAITGVVEVGHDFMNVTQQKELEKQFPDQSFHFEQVDRVVEESAMSAITYPGKGKERRDLHDTRNRYEIFETLH